MQLSFLVILFFLNALNLALGKGSESPCIKPRTDRYDSNLEYSVLQNILYNVLLIFTPRIKMNGFP